MYISVFLSLVTEMICEVPAESSGHAFPFIFLLTNSQARTQAAGKIVNEIFCLFLICDGMAQHSLPYYNCQ